MTCHFAR